MVGIRPKKPTDPLKSKKQTQPLSPLVEKAQQELHAVTRKAWGMFLKATAECMGYKWPIDSDALSKLALETTNPAKKRLIMDQALFFYAMEVAPDQKPKFHQDVANHACKYCIIMIKTIFGTLDDLPSELADAVTDTYVGCFGALYDFAFGTRWLGILKQANERDEDDAALNAILESNIHQIELLKLASAMVLSYRDVRLSPELQAAADLTVVPRMQHMLLGDHAPRAGSYRLIKEHDWWGDSLHGWHFG
jgi:hypothetical protein